MVIEHAFVTTMGSREALTAASEMLTRAGFAAETQNAFRLSETEWTSLQMKRGRKSANRAKDPTECPQRVRLDWDRHRITVAAAIEPRAVRRSFYVGGLVGMAITASRRSAKQTRDYSQLMILIATSLEQLLARRMTPDVAEQGWYAFQDELKAKAAKARKRSWIMVGILFAAIFAIVGLAIAASVNHW